MMEKIREVVGKEYARLTLDGEMQVWVDAIDSLAVW